MFKSLFAYDTLKEKLFYDRDKHENILSDPKSALGKKLNNCIMFCVFISVGVIIFETLPSFYAVLKYEFFVTEAVISAIFAIEYIYRFIKSKNKLHFPFATFNIIDLLSFLPFFLGLIFPALSAFNILKVLRLLRILRIFELSRQSPIALWFLKTIKEYHREYGAIFSIFLSVLVILSSFTYYVEFPVNEKFSSIPESLWWGIVTMATVGYGDMVPVTTLWKILWVGLILLGPVLYAVISSITILVFMDVAESHKITGSKVCRTCKTRNNEHANFCYHCGSQHFTDPDFTDRSKEDISFIKKLFFNK